MELVEILKAALQQQASDVHLMVGRAPILRRNRQIIPLPHLDVALTQAQVRSLIASVLSQDQLACFDRDLDLDCSFEVAGLARFRMNVLMQTAGMECVLRVIPSQVPSPVSLGLPQSVLDLVQLPRGLILVTGPTGSGKSTTLACLIDKINTESQRHIITIEDPIEFLHHSQRSIIRQREVGLHTRSFAAALRGALRQDPDVLMVGEMRDLETVALSLTAAETGHLCLSTLHTTDAAQTVDRIIDIFPPSQQAQVRLQLALTLKAVICQVLVPCVDGQGCVAARQIMMVNAAISNMIREGKTHMIASAIETGAGQGMISLDKSLLMLVRQGTISMEQALLKATDPDWLRRNS